MGFEVFLGLFLIALLLILDNFLANYIGYAIAITILIISIIVIIYTIKKIVDAFKNKNKTFGIVSIILIIVFALLGYCFNIYLPKHKLEYSSVLSMLVAPLIPCIVLNIIYNSKYHKKDEDNPTAAEILGLILIFGISIIVSLIVLGIGVSGGESEYIEVIKQAIRYKDREIINDRIREYGTNDYKIVIPKALKDYSKNNNVPENEVIDRLINNDDTTAENYSVKGCYNDTIDSYTTCTFIDYGEYGKFGKYRHIYVKLDKNTLDVVDFPKHHFDIADPNDEDFVSYMESDNNGTGKYEKYTKTSLDWFKRDKYDKYNLVKYAMIYLKNEKIEVNDDHFNDQLDYIDNKKGYDFYLKDVDGKTVIYINSYAEYQVNKETYEYENYSAE